MSTKQAFLAGVIYTLGTIFGFALTIGWRPW
jgi:hypothetical protein